MDASPLVPSHVLYGRETWCFTLCGEHRLRMYKNAVPREPIGHNTNKRQGGWIKLHNAELRNLYSSHNIVMVFTARTMRNAQTSHLV
jgi:hypothetical protein